MDRREDVGRCSLRAYPAWRHLAVGAMLMGQLGLVAQEWRTVDDFALAGGNAEAHGVAVDAVGGVYVVGTASGHGIVRYSADGGTNWSTRDDFVYSSPTNNPSDTNNVFKAITINPQGDLFVGGSSWPYVGLGGVQHWIIRRSRDQGASWQTVDDYSAPMTGPDQPGTNGAVYSLSSDAHGRVYGAGRMLRTGPSYPWWWVRGSDSGGTNWDTRLLLFAAYGGVSQLTWAGEDVYVTGSVYGDFSIGLIVRSGDYGATWSTNFEATNEVYYAINSDSTGYIYSAGNSWSSNSYDWVVRKAAPGGTDWTVLDKVTYGDSSGNGMDQASPSSIAVDAAGNVSVTGQLRERWSVTGTNGTIYGANQRWFTRRYSAATGQWNTTDVFSYSTNATSATNTHATAMGTAFAPDGSTFVVGSGKAESGQIHWVVRKGSAFTSRPRLQIAIEGRTVAVSWPTAYTNSALEWTDYFGPNQMWQRFTGTVSVVEGQNRATCEVTSAARFFRLKSAK